MRKRRLTITALVSVIALLGCEDATRPVAEEPLLSQTQARVIPNQYIVVFANEVTDPPGVARGMAIAHGLELRYTYSTALRGFAAVVPPARVAALPPDPRRKGGPVS
jgi:hypothetical protein